MIELKKKEGESALCSHCSEPIEELWCKEVRSRLGRRYVYFCPKCRKILGVSHRKGFFMG